MKKFLLIVAVAASALLVDVQSASAGRRGGRGGCGGGGCGYYGGGCGFGGCGMGYGMGCATCGGGYGGYGMGYAMFGGAGNYVAASGYTCAGGVCSIGGGTVLAQANPAGATLVVNLPADATLTIDDEPTASTSGSRVFVTPPLNAGKEFHYTLKAKVVRDGKVQTITEKVAVRAGEVSRVELTLPAAGVAAQ